MDFTFFLAQYERVLGGSCVATQDKPELVIKNNL